MLKRILSVTLVLLMLLSPALAEGGINLGGEGCDEMKYACTLPDGRLIFCGMRGTPGNYNEARARLLCLNPDGSVSWDYFAPDPGMGRFNWGTLLPDGTIGVIYTNAPYQELQAFEIRKFSQDGSPVGEPVSIMDDIGAFDPVNPLCIPKSITMEDGSSRLGFIGWDGNVLFSLPRRDKIWLWATLDAGDGALVLAGGEPGEHGNAKLMKVDLQGNTIWETVLPMMTSFGTSARINDCIRTSDGGYLGWILESGDDIGSGNSRWAYALVRFNANGRVLWMNQDAFSGRYYGCDALFEYDGKFVFMEGNYTDASEKQPRYFHWFDDEGNKLGETSLLIPRQDANPASDLDEVEIWDGGLFTMENGLWGLFSLRITNPDIRVEMDSEDEWIYRIPEM